MIGFWAASVFFGFWYLATADTSPAHEQHIRTYVYVSITHVVFVHTEDV